MSNFRRSHARRASMSVRGLTRPKRLFRAQEIPEAPRPAPRGYRSLYFRVVSWVVVFAVVLLNSDLRRTQFRAAACQFFIGVLPDTFQPFASKWSKNASASWVVPPIVGKYDCRVSSEGATNAGRLLATVRGLSALSLLSLESFFSLFLFVLFLFVSDELRSQCDPFAIHPTLQRCLFYLH